MKRHVLFLLAAALLSCGEEQKKEIGDERFFSGMFIYFDNAATLTDCATGVKYPVAAEGGYADAQRQYAELALGPMEPVYIEYTGRIENSGGAEAGTRPAAVIDRLQTFDWNRTCDWEYPIAGDYECDMQNRKSVLRLAADYSYTETVHVDAENSVEITGQWYRTTATELVLSRTSPAQERSSFEIIASRALMVRSSEGEPLVYYKVYL